MDKKLKKKMTIQNLKLNNLVLQTACNDLKPNDDGFEKYYLNFCKFIK